MTAKKNLPEIRFKGFGEEWVEKKIGEFCTETYGGGTPRTSETNHWDGDIAWIQSSDFTKEQLSNVVARKSITRDGVKHSATKLIPENSIAIVTRVGVGKLALMPYKYATSQDFLSLSKLKVEKWFGVYSIWNKLQGELYAVQGTSIKGITKEELLAKQIIVPTQNKEQTKIGSYLQQLDTLITLHQKKHDKLLKVKKAMLEKMFPKKGADAPEIRFKDFSEKWEERKLGEVTKITMGQSPNGVNYTNNPEDYILVQGNADMKNGLVVPRIWTKQVTKTADAGDLIFSVRAPVGEIGKSTYNVVIGRGVAAIRGNEFIFQSLKRMNENGYWKKLSAGSTFDSINSTDLTTAVISMTNTVEQTKIGGFFKNLDTLLTLHQSELDKLKSIKKASLEKMFV